MWHIELVIIKNIGSEAKHMLCSTWLALTSVSAAENGLIAAVKHSQTVSSPVTLLILKTQYKKKRNISLLNVLQ